MTLNDYLSQSGKTASELAIATNSAVSTITRAAKGELMPSRGLMEAIYQATGGAVTPNDFHGIAA
jgi:hypothetical protein